MSVLAEETSLVVRRDDLDDEYPGGADTFVEQAYELAMPPRFISDDQHLVSLSFHDADHAREGLAMIEKLDVNWVLIDPSAGPIHPVSWVSWATYAPNVVRIWRAGTQPGEFDLPEGWSPATSHHFDVYSPEETQRMLRLAVEDGVETFLDLDTGAQVKSEPDPPPSAPAEEPATPVHDALMAALHGIGWISYLTDAPTAHVDLAGKAAVYTNRYFVNEPAETLLCVTRAPLFVPQRARRRAMDFITRVNFRTSVGNFDLSLDDGRLAFRSAVDVEDSFLSQAVVRNLAANNTYMFDHYYPFLLEVVYGQRTPKEAFEAAEGA